MAETLFDKTNITQTKQKFGIESEIKLKRPHSDLSPIFFFHSLLTYLVVNPQPQGAPHNKSPQTRDKSVAMPAKDR